MSMALSDMISTLRSLSGDRQEVLFTDDDLARYINFSIREIAGRLECCTSAVTHTELSASTYPGGDGVITLGDVHVIRILRVLNADGIMLREVAMDMYERPGIDVQPQTTRELPHSYWFVPLEASIAPTNSAAYRGIKLYPYQDFTNPNFSITVHFSFYPADLTTDGDETCQLTPTLTEAAIYRALAHCKIQEENFQAAKFIMGDFEARIAQGMYELGPATHNSFGEVRSSEEVPTDYTSGI